MIDIEGQLSKFRISLMGVQEGGKGVYFCSNYFDLPSRRLEERGGGREQHPVCQINCLIFDRYHLDLAVPYYCKSSQILFYYSNQNRN
jgi:hypothetical protein